MNASRPPMPQRWVSACQAALLAIGLGACGGEAQGEAAAGDNVPAYAVDPRITPLLASCPKSDFYDRNVADVVPILVEKLERGGREPLRRAKEELAAMGEPAMLELKRFVEGHYSDRQGFGYIQNAIDCATLSTDPSARTVLLPCLSHPGDAVRLRAVQGLTKNHGRPEDFERVLALLDVEAPEQRHVIASALHGTDPARAEHLYLDWIEGGQHDGLWKFIALKLVDSRFPETIERCRTIYPQADLATRPFLVAPCAAAGDEAALEILRGWLSDPNEELRQLRSNAARAAWDAGLVDLLGPVLGGDPSMQLRAIAADAIASGLDPAAASTEERDRRLAWLRSGLDDLSPTVRGACLASLVRAGDELAIDRALAALTEAPVALGEAMLALRDRFAADSGLVTRTFERLMTRNALEEGLPLQRRTATLKSVGQLPTATAARFLLDSSAQHAGETVEGLSAHSWLAIQASNTGPLGRAELAERLASEDDPTRRLDLLWGLTAARTDEVRQRALALAEDPATDPWEVLFLADRLTELGPASQVAGRLKRLTARIDQPDVRRALQCLLWKWY